MEFSSERGGILFRTIGHCFNLWDQSFQREEKEDFVCSFFVEFQLSSTALFPGYINSHCLLQSIGWFAQQLCSVILNALTVSAIATLRVNLTVNKRGKEDRNISY